MRLPRARDTVGVLALPNGAACYRARLRQQTTLNVTAAEVHKTAKISTLRLGAPRAVFYDELDPEIEAALSKALEVLRRLTAGFRDVRLPPISDRIVPNIVLSENYAFHAPYFAKMPHLYHAAISRNLRQGSEATTAAYIQSRRAIGAVFSNVDLLVTPTTAMSPPTIEEAVRLGIEVELNRNTAPFNVYGLPTISVPCGFTSSGLPIGLQISGPRFGEANVLAWRTRTSKQQTGTRGGRTLCSL
jgi:aspartyl-tRNA(Asn)/glutamyl-tRNA(Gln) amidotransferase subunit A